MRQTAFSAWGVVAVTVVLAGLLGWPTAGAAQTVAGQARTVQATVLGLTTVLCDTGTLGGPDDAREASLLKGSVPSLLSGEVLHATTIGWPDQVAAESSLADLNLTVAGNGISAAFVMAQALALLGGAGAGSSSLDSLSINGAPIVVTGEANQTVPIPGGRVIVNEQTSSLGGITVNALHVIVDGVADVVIASAAAGI